MWGGALSEDSFLKTEGFEDDLYHEEFGSARRNGFQFHKSKSVLLIPFVHFLLITCLQSVPRCFSIAKKIRLPLYSPSGTFELALARLPTLD